MNELEGIAAWERLVLIRDAAKQSPLIRVLEASEDEEHKKQLREVENPDIASSFHLLYSFILASPWNGLFFR